MTTFACERRPRAAKLHRCAVCGCAIQKGARHVHSVGRFDGDFYSERLHADCHGLWGALFSDWGDPCEGMAYDLVALFLDSGDAEAVRAALDANRGHFPHAVARIGFQLRFWLDGEAA